MNNAPFGSTIENNSMQDLVDLCHGTIGYEQQVVDSGLEARILELMGAYFYVSAEQAVVQSHGAQLPLGLQRALSYSER